MTENMVCPITGEPCSLRPVIAEGLEYWINQEFKMIANIQAFKDARFFSWRGIIYGIVLITGQTFPDELMLPSIRESQVRYAELLATTCVNGVCTVRQQSRGE